MQLVILTHIPPLFKIGIRLGFSAVKHSWPWGPSLMILYCSPLMYYWPTLFGIFPVIQLLWLRNDWCLRSVYYWVHHVVCFSPGHLSEFGTLFPLSFLMSYTVFELPSFCLSVLLLFTVRRVLLVRTYKGMYEHPNTRSLAQSRR